MPSPSGEYGGINEATDAITTADRYPGPEKILADNLSESEINQWTEALTGFEANTVVTQEDGDVLLEILGWFEQLQGRLAEYVDDLGVQTLSRCDPGMVLFMVCIRDLQNQYELTTNMNQHKLDVLRGGRYQVNQEEEGAERGRGRGESEGSSEAVDQVEQVSDLRPPERTEASVSRIIRNTTLAKGLKRRYEYTCQVCDEYRLRTLSDRYAEAHHIQPLGEPHNGPDVAANILVLCPNHHADLDYGLIEIEPDTLTIHSTYQDLVDDTTLTLAETHEINEAYLEYHNEEISQL